MKKKLILVDGNSIIFRAYYATAYPGATLMQTSEGVYTNALFAFVNMFEKMYEEGADILVAFDTSAPTKRHEAYEEYKAGRKAMPEELGMQFPLVYKYLKHLGVKYYFQEGYEADDIIGTFANLGNDYDVHIYSSDRDLLQLVRDNVTVHLLKRGMRDIESYNPNKILEEFELTHDQMIDLKALMGDQSDNIPGVPGVGEKTGIRLLKEYETLENILENKENIKGRLGERLIEHEKLALLSKELVTIDVNADLLIGLKDLHEYKRDDEELISFFQKYELHNLVKRMDQPKVESTWEYKVLTDENEIREVLTKELALYFEFDDQNYHKSTLWGLGLSSGDKHYFIPSDVVSASLSLSFYLADHSVEKYIFNYKEALVYSWWHDFTIEGVTFDLLIAAYLINAYLGKEEFKYIVSKFEYDDVSYDEHIYGKGAKKGLPEDKSLYERHIVSKAKAIYDLKDKMLEELVKIDQFDLYKDIELPLSKVLAHMEFHGLTVDVDILNEQDKVLANEISELENIIHKLAGEEFTISSPKQLGEILFDKLGLPPSKKTKTGYSTNAEVLSSLLDKHEIIKYVLEYRQLTKLHSTYVEGVRQSLFDDNKVHTIYMQALTATGRLSSIEPNLQNIPVRTKEGREIRKFFVPSNNNYFISADYSQIELRILAEIANVESLKEAFRLDEDIHSSTAGKIFNKTEVTEDERHQAKAVNFGLIYGKKAWSLSEDLGVSLKQANEFIEAYFNAFPEIKDYMENIVKEAKKQGYVTTILNRRRYIPELTSRVFAQRSFGERTALNAPIQGSAADIIKKAMVDLYDYIAENKLQSRIILQVHDELILEVPEKEVELMTNMIDEIMKNAIKLSVPLKTSVSVGKSWYELE